MVNCMDDVWMRGEERIGFHFFEGEGDGFLAEGAADLLEGVELRGGCFLDEVDVGKAALTENTLAAAREMRGNQKQIGHTSPSNRRSLKLRLLILSCGELGKQKRQLVRVERRSMNICAILKGETDNRNAISADLVAYESLNKHPVLAATTTGCSSWRCQIRGKLAGCALIRCIKRVHQLCIAQNHMSFKSTDRSRALIRCKDLVGDGSGSKRVLPRTILSF